MLNMKQRTDAKNGAKRLKAITLNGAIERRPI